MDRAVWVCCRRGSGNREMWTHSGIVTVPPSKSAMITSNWKKETIIFTSAYDTIWATFDPHICLGLKNWVENKLRLVLWRRGNQDLFFLLREEQSFFKPIPITDNWKTHQFLRFRAEEGIHTNNERCGAAQNFEKFSRQDGNISETERKHRKWHVFELKCSKESVRKWWGETHLYLRGNIMARSPRQASDSLW